jgi:hypothetical protein
MGLESKALALNNQLGLVLCTYATTEQTILFVEMIQIVER